MRLELLRGMMGRLREMEDNYWVNVPYWIRNREERKAWNGGVWRVEPWEIKTHGVFVREWGDGKGIT